MWIFQIPILASFKQEFTPWKRESTGDTPKQHDVSLPMCHIFICLVEAFAESSPQWCLQNCTMIRQWYFPWYTVISTFLSLFALAWSITSKETSIHIKPLNGPVNGCDQRVTMMALNPEVATV